ncbi:MAG: cytidine deaminase [Saprospiraceae bacterium]|nr:cytidine deaminase [Saprospiraceae bacterium]
MKKRSVSCTWSEIDERTDLPDDILKLIQAAETAIENSYAPYSKFRVGAAAKMADGSLVFGSNMENASFPLCICAEKSCVTNAENNKHGIILESMAITAKHPTRIIDHPISPCGSCRQILVEKEQRQGAPIAVYLFGQTGPIWHFDSAEAFLPLPFDSNEL